MDLLREKVLPAPALTEYQHGRIRGGDALGQFEDASHPRARAQQRPELAFGDELLPQPLVFLLELNQLHQVGHTLAQLFNVKTLHEIIAGARFQRLERGPGGIKRGNDEHRQFVALLAQPVQQRHPVLARHDHIEQDDVRPLAQDGFSRRCRGLCFRNAVLVFERAAHPVSRRGLVIHNQDGSHDVSPSLAKACHTGVGHLSTPRRAATR